MIVQNEIVAEAEKREPEIVKALRSAAPAEALLAAKASAFVLRAAGPPAPPPAPAARGAKTNGAGTAAAPPSPPLPAPPPAAEGGAGAPPGDGAALAKRVANLSFGGAKPSTAELERLIGANDLVDEFWLRRALVAAKPVMRITLRDGAGRERGWATGFMVSPRVLLTNWHVFPDRDEAANAVAEAHYVLDIAGNPAASFRFLVRPDRFYFASQALDYSLVAVEETAQDGRAALADFGYHRLIPSPSKIAEGESMTLIQHPGGERRQFAIRANQLVQILDQFLWYQSDTAPGSSGAPAFNDSFQVVALHHSGAARRDDQGRYLLRDGRAVTSLDGIDDSQVDWVANEGVRISVLCADLQAQLSPADPYAREVLTSMQTDEDGDVLSVALRSGGGGAESAPGAMPGAGRVALPPGAAVSFSAAAAAPSGVLTIPLQLQVAVSVAGAGAAAAQPAVAAPASAAAVLGEEAMRYPVVDRDYSSRTGYDPDFLGVSAPLPAVTEGTPVALLADGTWAIPYEHFTVVVHKGRRLPLFTASNLDYSLAKRRPEPGDYSRDALDGIGENDSEKWFTDPRIPQLDQLPDVFYTRDGGSFDKGHVVRREDMCWGATRDQIVRANGDTFHVTNCTPQVAGFNRSANGVDDWGDLEDEIQKQAKTEQLSLFAGPILAETDRFFEGRDDFGPVKIQIPKEFWKVVLAKGDDGKLASYAFVLQQNLQNVPEEFKVTATWKPYQVSVADLESRLTGIAFPAEVKAADTWRQPPA